MTPTPASNIVPSSDQERGKASDVNRRGLIQSGLRALALLGTVASQQVNAQAPRPVLLGNRGTITLAGAQALIAEAENVARQIGVPMSIAVVDESGILKAFSRMDGAGPASVDIVQAKAYTAAAFRTSTQALATRTANQPAQVASFTTLPRVTLLPGGVPIMQGGMVIGGIGVGGGTGQQDIEVAEAALAALGVRP